MSEELDQALQERYDAFLLEIVREQALYTLESEEGFVLMGDDEGSECFAFWPNEKSCADHIKDDWKDCACQRIELQEFIEHWVPGLEKDGFKIAIHPTPDEIGLVIDATQLSGDLYEIDG